MKNTQVQTNKTKQTRQLKLTTVTRNDLSPGYQLVQASHSNIQFLIEHPQISKEWYKNPYLAALSTKDENSLKNIIKKAEEKGIKLMTGTCKTVKAIIENLCDLKELE